MRAIRGFKIPANIPSGSTWGSKLATLGTFHVFSPGVCETLSKHLKLSPRSRAESGDSEKVWHVYVAFRIALTAPGRRSLETLEAPRPKVGWPARERELTENGKRGR